MEDSQIDPPVRRMAVRSRTRQLRRHRRPLQTVANRRRWEHIRGIQPHGLARRRQQLSQVQYPMGNSYLSPATVSRFWKACAGLQLALRQTCAQTLGEEN